MVFVPCLGSVITTYSGYPGYVFDIFSIFKMNSLFKLLYGMSTAVQTPSTFDFDILTVKLYFVGWSATTKDIIYWDFLSRLKFKHFDCKIKSTIEYIVQWFFQSDPGIRNTVYYILYSIWTPLNFNLQWKAKSKPLQSAFTYR